MNAVRFVDIYVSSFLEYCGLEGSGRSYSFCSGTGKHSKSYSDWTAMIDLFVVEEPRI